MDKGLRYSCRVKSPKGFRGIGPGRRFTAELICRHTGEATARITLRLAFTSRVFHVSPAELALAIEAGHIVATKETNE